MPPPHPTSSTLSPVSGFSWSCGSFLAAHTACRMNLHRAGLKRCSGAKGPDGSHQAADMAANLAASLGSRDPALGLVPACCCPDDCWAWLWVLWKRSDEPCCAKPCSQDMLVPSRPSCGMLCFSKLESAELLVPATC